MNDPVRAVGWIAAVLRGPLRWALTEAERTGAAVEATMAWQHDSESVPASSLGLHPTASGTPRARSW